MTTLRTLQTVRPVCCFWNAPTVSRLSTCCSLLLNDPSAPHKRLVCVCAQSCPTLQLLVPQPTRLLCPWDSPGRNTGVHCRFLLQGSFPTQGLNPGLPHCRQILDPLSHQGSPQAHVTQFNKYMNKLREHPHNSPAGTRKGTLPESEQLPRGNHWAGFSDCDTFHFLYFGFSVLKSVEMVPFCRECFIQHCACGIHPGVYLCLCYSAA